MMTKNQEKQGEGLTEQEKRDFAAYLLKTFGTKVSVDNEMLPYFYMIFRMTATAEASANKASEKMTVASTKMSETATGFENRIIERFKKVEPRQFRFSTPKEAFWFSFGKWGLPLVAGIVMLSVCWMVYFVRSTQIDHSEQVSALLRHSTIRRVPLQKGYKADVMEFKPSGNLDNAEVGKEFFYDKDCKCVLVPINSIRPGIRASDLF
jgi:hypothetical protein